MRGPAKTLVNPFYDNAGMKIADMGAMKMKKKNKPMSMKKKMHNKKMRNMTM